MPNPKQSIMTAILQIRKLKEGGDMTCPEARSELKSVSLGGPRHPHWAVTQESPDVLFLPSPPLAGRILVRICPPGAGKAKVAFLLQSPADSDRARGRWTMG